MTTDCVRIGPVHFQSLESELEPVVRYLSGHLLNAGCGNRDLDGYLKQHGVTKLTRYDIESTDRDVVIGPLESMPFANEMFDSVLCNAVLEHVVDAESSIEELARVVKPDGYIVVAVPFLQPFHPCPGDYRRYTASGLAELGRRAGLEVVEVLPVHSLAQTLGWILWEYACEKGGFLRKVVAGTFAFVATRIWNKTDPKLIRNANTFQAVFRRSDPAVRRFSNEWRHTPIPASSAAVPTMLVPLELRLLNYLTGDYYSGAGEIIDAGAFLGGSTIALADGLRRNLRRRGVAEEKRIHSYDRFEVEEWTRSKYFPELRKGDQFRPLYDRNIAAYESLVTVHAGDIRSFEWSGLPIEILFIDVAKHWDVCDWVTWQFFPSLIPGRSIVVQQDYLYHQWVAWIHVTMEYYAGYFECLCDTEINSVAFLNTKKIPPDVLRKDTVASLTTAQKIELMNRAANRFTGKKRELLRAAQTHFVELLREMAVTPS